MVRNTILEEFDGYRDGVMTSGGNDKDTYDTNWVQGPHRVHWRLKTVWVTTFPRD